MGLLQSCFARKNKVGVAKEEMEAYEKVRKTMVTEGVTEKRGGVTFDFLPLSPRKLKKCRQQDCLKIKKGDFEKWRESQEKAEAEKQERAQHNREEARIQKEIEVAHKEMERLENASTLLQNK